MFSHFKQFIAVLAFGSAAVLGAEVSGNDASERVLRIAADPNNLPFTNDRLEGFENKIAELLAKNMGARVEYTWWPQRRGFIRNTLNAGTADLVLGVPAGYDLTLTTKPYYRSGYVVVTPAERNLAIDSFDDPRLRNLRIGVQIIGDDFINSPPAHALSRRGIVTNLVGFTVYGDYSRESPPAEIIHAVSDGGVDLAMAWGPMAGFFASRSKTPLKVEMLKEDQEGPLRFQFSIAMGVRKGNHRLKEEIDEILLRKRSEIASILQQFNIPTVGRGTEALPNGNKQQASRE